MIRNEIKGVMKGRSLIFVGLFARVLLAAAGCLMIATTAAFPQQKLVFKDGTTEKVERYEVKGDRVRFKSYERNEWEEVPLNLVDLAATKELNEKEARELKATPRKLVDAPEEGSKDQALNTLKPAGEVEISPGVKLPEAYGLYAWDGKKLAPLTEVGTRKKTDRKSAIINRVAPAPIMKQKITIQLDGPSAEVKLSTLTPVFYVYLPEDGGGQLSLFRMIVTKSARVLKEVSHSQITGSDRERSQEYVFTPSIRIAENVFKVFPEKPLAEGEYCLVALSPTQNQYTPTVWDFSIAK
ncbi:MAG: hypothetical protein WBN92_11695 [Terriglobia bacterium]